MYPQYNSSAYPQPLSYGNPPSTSSQPQHEQCTHEGLRVKIVEEYRIDPPIPISASLMPAPSNTQTEASPDFSMERRILEEGTTSDVEDFFAAREPDNYQDPSIKQYMEMGFSRAQASLGIAYCQQAKLSDAEVVDYANNQSQLQSMGYSISLSTGALVQTSNDLNRAAELLRIIVNVKGGAL
eukprot:gene14543-20583_t